MARRPAVGRVKTRLAAQIGAEGAAATYASLLDDTLTQAALLAEGSLYLALEPGPPASQGSADTPEDEDAPAIAAATSPTVAPVGRWTLLPQRGSGLGERLAAVFADLFATGHSEVVIIGSDSPALPSDFLERAFHLLTDAFDIRADASAVGVTHSPDHAPGATADARRSPADAVLGPAFDGGYYLIGLTREAWLGGEVGLTRLLADSPTGTAHAARHTVRGLEGSGLRVATLPYWFDVDTGTDLALARAVRSGERRGGSLDRLREVYLHVTHRCATGCPQCYLRDARAPGRAAGSELDTAAWRDVIDQAAALGAGTFVFIGGDPFLRPDLLELIDHATGAHGASARLFFSRSLDGQAADRLARAGHGRLTPLISVDGPAEVHDGLRGAGSFEAALSSVGGLLAAGLRPVANTVLLRPVLPGLPSLARSLAGAGVAAIHLILPHRRGGLAEDDMLVPTGAEILEALVALEPVAAEVGLVIDNFAGWKNRLRAPRDLCGAGCTLLAVDPEGSVHACPITCGDEGFVAGDLRRESLERIWRHSPVLDLLRAAGARDRSACAGCAQVDACGGECWVQAHYDAVARGRRAGYTAGFPYCDLVRPVLDRLALQHPPSPDTAGAGVARPPQRLTPIDCI